VIDELLASWGTGAHLLVVAVKARYRAGAKGKGRPGWLGDQPPAGGRNRVSEPKPKPFEISKWAVWETYRRVKANKGAAGVDEQSIEEFAVKT